jgi:hypothetical protein
MTIYVIQSSQSSVYEVITTFLTTLIMEAAGSSERYMYVTQTQCHCTQLHAIIQNGNYRLNHTLQVQYILAHTCNKGRSLILDHKYILLQHRYQIQQYIPCVYISLK